MVVGHLVFVNEIDLNDNVTGVYINPKYISTMSNEYCESLDIWMLGIRMNNNRYIQCNFKSEKDRDYTARKLTQWD